MTCLHVKTNDVAEMGSLGFKPLSNDQVCSIPVDMTLCKERVCVEHSKTVPGLSPIHKEGNEPCFIYLLIYDCTTFTSLVNVLKKEFCQI